MALPHQSIATISSPQFINLQPLDVNPFMSACEIKVFYVGKNRNGTFISKEAAEEMSKTLRGAPIVGYFKQENQDFRDHGQQMIWDSQGIKFNVLTRPYGFVDPNAHVWFQKFNDTDEFGNTVERQYLMTTGYLWTGQYEEAKMALEDGKPQSMQLDDQSVNGHWAEDAKSGLEFFIINDAIFSKLCILGDDIEPCFEGASITKPSISNTISKTVDNNFKYTLFTMMQELKNALQGGSIVGSNNDNEENPAEEYTVEEVVETSEVVEETAEQPSEAEVPAEFTAEEISEDNAEEAEESSEPESEFAKKDDDEEEENEEDSAEEEASEEEDDDKKKYTLLSEQYSELEGKYNELKAQYDQLVEYKANIENKEKDAKIAEFSMLSEEDKADVIANKANYTLEEIEEKLALICYKKKINFVTEVEEKEEESSNDSTVTFTLDEHETNQISSWIKAVQENM